jgi:hypothetical protein
MLTVGICLRLRIGRSVHWVEPEANSQQGNDQCLHDSRFFFCRGTNRATAEYNSGVVHGAGPFCTTGIVDNLVEYRRQTKFILKFANTGLTVQCSDFTVHFVGSRADTIQLAAHIYEI